MLQKESKSPNDAEEPFKDFTSLHDDFLERGID